jgi:hypothetical protein
MSGWGGDLLLVEDIRGRRLDGEGSRKMMRRRSGLGDGRVGVGKVILSGNALSSGFKRTTDFISTIYNEIIWSASGESVGKELGRLNAHRRAPHATQIKASTQVASSQIKMMRWTQSHLLPFGVRMREEREARVIDVLLMVSGA